MCEQLLALSKEHFSADEYVPERIGVPWCMYQLALACDWVNRQAEGQRLKRSALRLCEDYCHRHADVPVPAALRRLMVAMRAQLGLQSMDSDDLDTLLEQLTSQQQLHGRDSIQCARTWEYIYAYHWQARNYLSALDAAMEIVRIRSKLFGPQHREQIASCWVTRTSSCSSTTWHWLRASEPSASPVITLHSTVYLWPNSAAALPAAVG